MTQQGMDEAPDVLANGPGEAVARGPVSEASPAHSSLSIGNWHVAPVAPWRRYGARMLDIMVNGSAGIMLFAFALAIVEPLAAERIFGYLDGPFGLLIDTMGTLAMSTAVCAMMMATLGTTVGKIMFGIMVTRLDGEPLRLTDSVWREGMVWTRGLAFGIPLVSIITMFLSYGSLTTDGTTAWDKNHYLVRYRHSDAQPILTTVGFVMIVGARFLFAWLARM